MAKKLQTNARKKTTKKSAANRSTAKKSAAARGKKLVAKKSAPKAKSPKRKKSRKAPTTMKQKVTGAFRTVIDTVKGTDQLRNRLEQPGTSETE